MRFLLIGISIISFCSLVFLLLSYIPSLRQETSDTLSTEIEDVILYFQPEIVSSSCENASMSAQIYLDSGSAPLSTAQIELRYDPTVLYNVLITPATQNFFGEASEYEITLQEIRQEYGRISFVIHTQQNQKAGNASVAELTFSIYPQAASSSSQITFLNKSTVLSNTSKESLLHKTIPLTIYCQK